ncbi:hypothetical protein Tco_0397716 [Tanacetum coccineum]
MLAIFHNMIKESVEVFMDNFSVFGDSFKNCLNNLDKMLKRCKDANLVLNWEKCHFMDKEGIVLGHKVSRSGLEVDKSKINNDETIEDDEIDNDFPGETLIEISTKEIPDRKSVLFCEESLKQIPVRSAKWLYITLGWVSRVDEMILARERSGFAGKKVWDDIPVVTGFVGRERRL